MSHPGGVTCGCGVPSNEGLFTVSETPVPHCPKISNPLRIRNDERINFFIGDYFNKTTVPLMMICFFKFDIVKLLVLK